MICEFRSQEGKSSEVVFTKDSLVTLTNSENLFWVHGDHGQFALDIKFKWPRRGLIKSFIVMNYRPEVTRNWIELVK